MNTLTSRISEKILETSYNINITKPVYMVNDRNKRQDTVFISNEGRDKQSKIEELKERIQKERYEFTEDLLDHIAENIASLFVPTLR